MGFGSRPVTKTGGAITLMAEQEWKTNGKPILPWTLPAAASRVKRYWDQLIPMSRIWTPG